MHVTRRDFLQAAAVVGSVGSAGAAVGAQTSTAPTSAPAGSGKKLLILGGTRFLGPALVDASLARGHTPTLFNRGRSNPHLFPDLEKLKGNRDPKVDEGLTALEGRTWDAVIDTSGYFPRIVRASAELLRDAVEHYLFISSISVYGDAGTAHLDETAPVGTIEDETVEEITGETYGPLKALCEQAADGAMSGRSATVRPGLIVGPRDGTDRFTYWPVRIERGGEVMAPGDPNDPGQIIDVRDLAELCLNVTEQRLTGAFNATNPSGGMPMAELLYACKAVTGGDARLTWVDADFLESHEVSAWMDMPVWVTPTGEYAGFGTVNCDRAVKAGMPMRPLADTVRDTLAWFHTLPPERQAGLRAGIKPEREAEVLAAWHAREG